MADACAPPGCSSSSNSHHANRTHASNGVPEEADGVPRAPCGVLVFARLPVEGRVKTRLAAGVGPRAACEFYSACLRHTLHVVASLQEVQEDEEGTTARRIRAYVYHSSSDRTPEFAAHMQGLGMASRLEVRAQAASPDLGAKLHHALSHAKNTGGHSKVVVIGSDIPDISCHVLGRALQALDKHEVVVGPAADGGYYLIGMTRVERGVFEGVKWSTPSVLEETLQRVAACGLDLAPLDTLPMLRDVDTAEDLAEWVAQAEAVRGGAAPAPPRAGQLPATVGGTAGGPRAAASDFAAAAACRGPQSKPLQQQSQGAQLEQQQQEAHRWDGRAAAPGPGGGSGGKCSAAQHLDDPQAALLRVSCGILAGRRVAEGAGH